MTEIRHGSESDRDNHQGSMNDERARKLAYALFNLAHCQDNDNYCERSVTRAAHKRKQRKLSK